MCYMNLGSENLARKLPGNRLAFISETVNIKQWQLGVQSLRPKAS